MKRRKFMQVLDSKKYALLDRRAKHMGITVQEMIRAVIVPFYLELHPRRAKKK